MYIITGEIFPVLIERHTRNIKVDRHLLEKSRNQLLLFFTLALFVAQQNFRPLASRTGVLQRLDEII